SAPVTAGATHSPLTCSAPTTSVTARSSSPTSTVSSPSTRSSARRTAPSRRSRSRSSGAPMHDVLGYAGKRGIVAGASSGVGSEIVRLLVDHGAEVHAIDTQRPSQRDIASFTESDLRNADQIESAVAKIGSVVNGLFHCPRIPDDAAPIEVVLVQFCAFRLL